MSKPTANEDDPRAQPAAVGAWDNGIHFQLPPPRFALHARPPPTAGVLLRRFPVLVVCSG